MHLLNAFSLNMLGGFPAVVRVEEISLEKARHLARGICSACGGTPDPQHRGLSIEDAGAWGGQSGCGDLHRFEPLASAVGHTDTAAVFADVLGVPVPAARVTVSLKQGDAALVGQCRGPRLPEGATRLPEEATIQWLLVSVE